MPYRFVIFAMHAVEVVFFTGLIGCALVVIFSWISIFGDGFTNDEDEKPPRVN